MSVSSSYTQIQYKITKLCKNVKRLQRNKAVFIFIILFFNFNAESNQNAFNDHVKSWDCSSEEYEIVIKQLKAEVKQKGDLEG